MKKIILLVSMLLVLSGCEAVYTLEINGDDYKEQLEVNNYVKESWGSGDGSYQESIRINAQASIATDYRNNVNNESNERFPGIKYYVLELIETSNNLGVKYNNTFTLDEYRYSNLAGLHFEDFKIKASTEIINIEGGKVNNVFKNYSDLNKLTIKVKTNHEVIEHNADEVLENTYYWYLTNSNYESKTVIFQISNGYNENVDLWQLDSNGYFGINSLIVIYVLIGFLALGGAVFIFFKIKNSNR